MSATAPFGFRPVRHTDGSCWNGQTIACVPASGTAIFVGDVLEFNGSASTGTIAGIDTEGLPTAIRCTATAVGQKIAGVVVGFSPDPNALGQKHMGAAAADVRIAYVAPATPNTVFEVTADEGTAQVDAADIMLNTALVTTAGSTTTGISGMKIDGNAVATTATLPVRIIGMSKRVGNSLNTATVATASGGCVFDVIFNTSQFATNAVGVAT